MWLSYKGQDNCLEVVISGHTEPVTGNSVSILSPVTPETYPIRGTIQTTCYHAYGHQVGWVIRYPVLLFLVPLGSRKKSSSST